MRQVSAVKKTTIKTPKNRIETPLKETAYPQGDLFQKVQEKAYQLFEARGYVHGCDVEDWIQAEKIVRGA